MQIIFNSILSTLTGALIGYFVNRLKKMKIEESDIKDSVRSMLRSDITNYYYRAMERGYILRWEKENVSYLYTSYKNLDGNSYIDIIMVDIEELPVKNEI
jgi:hypothetical protein